MADIETLKQALLRKVTDSVGDIPSKQILSELQYSDGLSLVAQTSGWTAYQNFIIPQLSRLLERCIHDRKQVSLLEVGPGPKSIIGFLPAHLRRGIEKYVVFEPNSLFASQLSDWLHSSSGIEDPLPSLKAPPTIYQSRFFPGQGETSGKFDIVLFCHSMYGLRPARLFIEEALKMLSPRPEAMVVVFHRDKKLDFDGLASPQTISSSTETIEIADDDSELDNFSSFIVNFTVKDSLQVDWREVCRGLGQVEDGHLTFRLLEQMTVFNSHATAVGELKPKISKPAVSREVKNWQARLHTPASIVTPKTVKDVQECILWAIEHKAKLTVIGGGSTGHCIWPNTVAVDMSAFNQMSIVQGSQKEGTQLSTIEGPSNMLLIAGSGCTSGELACKAMEVDLTIPLGGRPSVGAGMWLQGGIGHLTRLYGLTSDAIIGAVMISVASGEIFYVGVVPENHRPLGAVRPANEEDLLWAIRGAGTNFGIVLSLTFKTYSAPTYTVQHWKDILNQERREHTEIMELDQFTKQQLGNNSTIDAYLYRDNDQIQLGLMLFHMSLATPKPETKVSETARVVFGRENSFDVVNGLELYEKEKEYMAEMYPRHGGGKNHSFKRCVLMKNLGSSPHVNALTRAIESSPSDLCYIQIVQGGGAANELGASETAFGCREWDFACVITGVWSRHQDGTEAVPAAIQWVYETVNALMVSDSGIYSTDLGPDNRDSGLAIRAFGPNRPRLAQLKKEADPYNLLAYACPLLDN